MDQQPSSSKDVIQDKRELFVSAEHLGQILAPSSGTSSQLITLREGRPFFSVHRFNELLSSFSAEQLEIIPRQNEAGHENLALRLVDDQGDEVPTLNALRQDEWALHSTISSDDEQFGGDDDNCDQGPFYNEGCDVNRHDTPFDSESRLSEQEHKSTLPREHIVSESINSFDEANNRADRSTVLANNQSLQYEPLNNSSSNTDSAQVVHTYQSQQYDDNFVRKLRALRLTDAMILNRLLENRSPLALSPLSKTRDEFVHLCTLQNGKVFAVKLLRDLHAHDDKLELATLNDAALLEGPLTGYQRNELSRILVDIEKTACAQEFWSSAHLVPESRREDYLRIIPKPKDLTWKLYNEYDTMGDFKSDLELLVQNVELFHGSFHEVTAAAEHTVQEIVNRMEEAAAVGINDYKESLFLGLVREIFISEGPTTTMPQPADDDNAMPRFVLPLGKLYNIQSQHLKQQQQQQQPPHFCGGYILMDISTPRKAIWLYQIGPERSYLVMLADEVARWKLSSGPGKNDGGLMKGGDHDDKDNVRRTKLTKAFRESRINFPLDAMVMFKRADRAQLTKAIKEGWGWEVPPPVDLVHTPKKEAQRQNKTKKTDKRVRPVFDGGSVSMRKKRGAHVLDSDVDEEEWVPQTEHRKSKKAAVTPTGRQHSGKPPRTI